MTSSLLQMLRHRQLIKRRECPFLSLTPCRVLRRAQFWPHFLQYWQKWTYPRIIYYAKGEDVIKSLHVLGNQYED